MVAQNLVVIIEKLDKRLNSTYSIPLMPQIRFPKKNTWYVKYELNYSIGNSGFLEVKSARFSKGIIKNHGFDVYHPGITTWRARLDPKDTKSLMVTFWRPWWHKILSQTLNNKRLNSTLWTPLDILRELEGFHTGPMGTSWTERMSPSHHRHLVRRCKNSCLMKMGGTIEKV